MNTKIEDTESIERSLPFASLSPPSTRDERSAPGLMGARQQFYLGPALSGAQPHFHPTAYNSLVYGAKQWLLWAPQHAFFARNETAFSFFERAANVLDRVSLSHEKENGERRRKDGSDVEKKEGENEERYGENDTDGGVEQERKYNVQTTENHARKERERTQKRKRERGNGDRIEKDGVYEGGRDRQTRTAMEKTLHNAFTVLQCSGDVLYIPECYGALVLDR